MASDTVETNSRSHTFFRAYVSVVLTLIVILLAVLIAMLAYAGQRVDKAANTKASDVNQQLKNINTNLQKFNEKVSNTPSIPAGYTLPSQ